MTTKLFMAAGESIDDACIELKAQITLWNEDHGNKFQVPEDVREAGTAYKVEVRLSHGKYMSGGEKPDFQHAYTAAVGKTGAGEDLANYRFRVTARYDLNQIATSPARAGSPSGAAPYDRRAGRDITRNML